MSGRRVGGSVLAFVALAACGGSGSPVDGGADAAQALPPDAAADDAAAPTDATPAAGPPIVILMIGDGMGLGQLEAASRFAHGAPGQLALDALPVRGRLTTASLSGITDSAAAATTMATGARTWNGVVGLDRDLAPVETLVELARRRGLGAGVVTTASLPHATPAAFTAHQVSRHGYLEVADEQALVVQPDVLLGGGQMFYLPAGHGSVRTDGGLLAPLEADGYVVVQTAGELAAVAPGAAVRVAGVFAPEHLDYVVDRPAESTQPTLTAMSLAALELLDARGTGFFLMIEGARIDMASHGNLLEEAIGETLAFDEAVAAVAAWASGRPEVTLLVTADHECGGLAVVAPQPAGTLPGVTWRWGQHTNTQVAIFGLGPGAEIFAGEVRDHTWVHAAAVARLTGQPLAPPPPALVPDGRLGDLAHVAAVQVVESGFGAGYNQLDSLRVAADDRGLAIGVEGLFEWSKNAVVLLIDADLGAGTGPSRMDGALADENGRIDAILTGLGLDAPPLAGFGVDLAVVTWGGVDARTGEKLPDAGLRGIHGLYGEADNLWWYDVATNFGDGVRTLGGPAPPAAAVPGEGWEVHVPWERLFPGRDGGVPPGATIGIAAVLVNDDGGYTSNQALPPFAAGTANPGRTLVALPGVVSYVVDADGDGVGDGWLPPETLP